MLFSSLSQLQLILELVVLSFSTVSRFKYHSQRTWGIKCFSQAYHSYNSSLNSSSSSPSSGGGPPAPWYSLAIIGCTISSISFFCALRSSAVASWFSSNQAIFSLITSSILLCSSSSNLPPSFSLSDN